MFTLATYVGSLKARYAQWWSPLFAAFQMTGLTVFVWPFVHPYYRATVYSGDRIAYACCGDLDVSLEAVYCALVGKEVAPHLRADGLAAQALSVRRRRLLRFAQLLRATPHATNRYLELLAFASQVTPDAIAAHRSDLATTGQQAEAVLTKLADRRPHQNAPVVGVGLAALAISAGLFAGIAFRNSPVAQFLADSYASAANEGESVEEPSGTGSTSVPEPSPTESSSPSPTDTLQDQDTAALLVLVPSDLRDSCTPATSNSDGAVVGLNCYPTDDGPALLRFFAYTDSDAMATAFDDYGGDLPTGSCSTGEPSRQTWSVSGATQGPLACYTASTGDQVIVWGSNDKAVLAVALDAGWSESQMYDWWRNDGPNLQ